MAEEVSGVGPKVAVCAFESKQFGQLRTGQKQRHAAFETDHDAFGNKSHQRAGLDEPGGHSQTGDQDRGPRRKGGESLGIAPRYLPERRTQE